MTSTACIGHSLDTTPGGIAHRCSDLCTDRACCESRVTDTALIVRGAGTGAYKLGYERGAACAEPVLYPPADEQGRWLYMNGVEDGAAARLRYAAACKEWARAGSQDQNGFR